MNSCSTLGRVITGRSTPGYPVRYRNNLRTEDFGTTAIPPRATQLQDPNCWGAFVAGLFIGGIIAAILVTPAGRGVAGAAAYRMQLKLRG